MGQLTLMGVGPGGTGGPTPPVTYRILTETGDFLVTEAGDYLITEDAP